MKGTTSTLGKRTHFLRFPHLRYRYHCCRGHAHPPTHIVQCSTRPIPTKCRTRDIGAYLVCFQVGGWRASGGVGTLSIDPASPVLCASPISPHQYCYHHRYRYHSFLDATPRKLQSRGGISPLPLVDPGVGCGVPAVAIASHVTRTAGSIAKRRPWTRIRSRYPPCPTVRTDGGSVHAEGDSRIDPERNLSQNKSVHVRKLRRTDRSPGEGR